MYTQKKLVSDSQTFASNVFNTLLNQLCLQLLDVTVFINELYIKCSLVIPGYFVNAVVRSIKHLPIRNDVLTV